MPGPPGAPSIIHGPRGRPDHKVRKDHLELLRRLPDQPALPDPLDQLELLRRLPDQPALMDPHKLELLQRLLDPPDHEVTRTRKTKG